MADCSLCKKMGFEPLDDMWSLHSPPLPSINGQSDAWLFCSLECLRQWVGNQLCKHYWIESDRNTEACIYCNTER